MFPPQTVLLSMLALANCSTALADMAGEIARPMATAVTASSDDRILDVRDPKIVAAALQEAGYKAELKTGKDGDPFISSAANGAPFTVEFYGCDKTGCNSFQFRSWYKHEALFTPALANEWNAGKRFVKLAIDEDGDLNEYMDVTATGRMTYANFADWVDWYETMDGSVDKFLADKRKGVKPA